MNDAKRLIEEATPLPWRQYETHQIVSVSDTGEPDDLGAVADCYESPDAALIVYAVNRLPDYEAAVEALDELLHVVDIGDLDRLPEVEAAAYAAVNRLREQVPA
jgi:GTPase SAR1 family protein